MKIFFIFFHASWMVGNNCAWVNAASIHFSYVKGNSQKAPVSLNDVKLYATVKAVLTCTLVKLLFYLCAYIPGYIQRLVASLEFSPSRSYGMRDQKLLKSLKRLLLKILLWWARTYNLQLQLMSQSLEIWNSLQEAFQTCLICRIVIYTLSLFFFFSPLFSSRALHSEVCSRGCIWYVQVREPMHCLSARWDTDKKPNQNKKKTQL